MPETVGLQLVLSPERILHGEHGWHEYGSGVIEKKHQSVRTQRKGAD